MDIGLAFGLDCLLLMQKASIFSSLLIPHVNKSLNPKPNYRKLLYSPPRLWKPKQQNLNFSVRENNFSSLFYEKTRLKYMIKTGKEKTLKIML